MIENRPGDASQETVRNIEERMRDHLSAATSLPASVKEQSESVLPLDVAEAPVAQPVATVIQVQAAQHEPPALARFPETPAVMHQHITLDTGVLVSNHPLSFVGRLSARIKKPFSQDLSVRERVRSIPLLGYAFAWANALIKLPVTRHHHQVEIDFLHRKLALSEDKITQVNTRLSEAQRYIDSHISYVIHAIEESQREFAQGIVELRKQLENRIQALGIDTATRLQALEQVRAANRLHLLEMLDVGTRVMKLEQIEAARKLKHFAQLVQQSQSESSRLKDQIDKLDLQMEQLRGAMQNGGSPRLTPLSSPTLDRVSDASDRTFNSDQFFSDFEDAFRGKKEEIKRRLEVYLPHVLKHTNDASMHAGFSVVDVGCGRGEWLELMAEQGISALGIDLNEQKVKACLDAGLAARAGDAISYLHEQEAASLSVITGFHIIEHLPFETLIALFDAAFAALKPGGTLIFETPNPENLLVGACNFYFDPTHLSPIVPAVAQFIATQRGFQHAEIMRLHPYPDDHLAHGETEVDSIVNRYLFGAQDYALIAHK